MNRTIRSSCHACLVGLTLLLPGAAAFADAVPLTGHSVGIPAADATSPAAFPEAPAQNPSATRPGPPPGTAGSPATAPLTAPADPCDYWIVSSRNCRGRAGDTSCLNYFHRASDRELRDAGREAFRASIRPDVPLCFVVHGSYNWWRDVVSESKKINRWVRSADPGAPLQVVFFTWPSDGNMPIIFPIDIAVLGRKSAAHSYYLARLISELPTDQPVSLLGHSHGARASVAALHLLGGGALEDGQTLPPGAPSPVHLRAVLIAAAIDRDWLNPGQRYGQALIPPERVLLLRNSRDATLAIYPLRKGWSGQALGRHGLTTQDRLAMHGLHAKIVDLDAAQFAGPYHSFADYHEHPELAAAALPYVYMREDAQLPAAAPTRPYDDQAEPPMPIRPKANRETPAASEPSAGPQLVPAGTPRLAPPETDDEPAPQQSASEPPRLLRIIPRSQKASQQKLRGEPAASGAGDDLSPPRHKVRPFELWIEG